MNALFKKSLMSTAFILMSAGVMAEEEISGDFAWTGYRDVDTSSMTDFCIKISDKIGDGLAFDAGKLKLAARATDVNIIDVKSSSELGFTVVARNPKTNACDGEKIAFKFRAMKYQIMEDNGEYPYPGNPWENFNKLKFWTRIVTPDSDVTNSYSNGDYENSINYNVPADTDVSFWVTGDGLNIPYAGFDRTVAIQLNILIEKNAI